MHALFFAPQDVNLRSARRFPGTCCRGGTISKTRVANGTCVTARRFMAGFTATSGARIENRGAFGANGPNLPLSAPFLRPDAEALPVRPRCADRGSGGKARTAHP